MTRIVAIGLAASLLGPSAWAEEAGGTAAATVSVRVGTHIGFGRVVFDVAAADRYRLTREGDTVSIRFSAATALGAAPPGPNNVRSLRTTAANAEIVVVPGAILREMRVDGHVVIDVLDPAAQVSAKPAAPVVQTAAPPAAHVPDTVMASDGPPATASVSAARPAVGDGPSPAMTQKEQPGSADNSPLAGPPIKPTAIPAEGAAFTIPFGPRTGAALFRRGGSAYAVFDERRPVDLAALHASPVFEKAVVRELQTGTLIGFNAPANLAVALTQTPSGWKIAMQAASKPTRAIPLTPNDGQLGLPVEAPGNVVSLADPDSGATLLVGTLRNPGQAVLMGRRTPEFAFVPAVQGVVVEPFADSIALRAVPAGFVLTGGVGGLAMTKPSPATEAATVAMYLTRRFKLPAQSADALSHRLTGGIADAAMAPPRARGPKRRAVATIMLSLGLAAEAQALLAIVAEQDPKEAASPDTIGLTAIAGLLAGRPGDAAGIADPRLTGSDEVALWRGVRQAMQEDGSPEAASVFAATAPLVPLYPPGIRDRVLPLVAETMILGGEAAAAKRLLATAKDAKGLGFARALLKQADGDAAGALEALDALAAGHDQRDRVRAATRSVELRLAAGQLEAGQAADALDKLRYAWRGDKREVALRERVADLRQRAGAWRAGLAELRSAEADFPDRAQALHAHLSTMFATLLEGEATDALTPLDLVALVDENADLIKAMPERAAFEARLADRLLALDLPARAAPLLEKLAASAPDSAGRGGFGTRLAELRLREGDAPGVLTALAASAGPNMEPTLTEQRAILASTAKARLGDTPGAIEALAGLTGAGADTARAALYEQAGDWPAAQRSLAAMGASAIPESGDLTDVHRQLLVRLAIAAERADDREALGALRATMGARFGGGPLADMLRLLTAEPVRAAGDLPRAAKEMGLARAVPAGLAALKTH